MAALETGQERIGIRDARVNARLSEETTCFTATLYFDGARVGTAANRGNGGCNEYSVDRGVLAQMEDVARRWCASNIDWWKPHKPEALDAMVGELVARQEEERMVARRSKAHTLFRLKDDRRGEWRMLKGPRHADDAAWIRNRYGDRVERIV